MTRAIILAAGESKRLDDPRGCPKCFRQIGDVTVLESLTARLGSLSVTIVINEDWPLKYQQLVSKLGRVLLVEPGRNVGHTMATGLRDDNSSAFIFNADNFVPPGAGLWLPHPGSALFDPWEWITIWHAFPWWADHLEATCDDRVEYLAQGHVPFFLRRTGWININRTEDLLRAKVVAKARA